MSNKTLTAEQIMARGDAEGFTAYQIAKLINAKLAEANVEQIRPQMMYNYSKNGLIAKGKKGDMTATYTTAEVIAFVEKFATKRIAKAQSVVVETTVEEIESTECEGQMALEI